MSKKKSGGKTALSRILGDPQGRRQLREALRGERDSIELSDGAFFSYNTPQKHYGPVNRFRGTMDSDLKSILNDSQGCKQFTEVMNGERDVVELSDGTQYTVHNVTTGKQYGLESKEDFPEDSFDSIDFRLAND